MSELTLDKIIEHIVGRRSRGFSDVDAHGAPRAACRCSKLQGPQRPAQAGQSSISPLYAGEVVGVAGLLGSGRSALARVLFGIDPKASGEIRIKGAPVEIENPRDAIANGLALVPEDRLRQGLVLEH